ncbi:MULTISPECIES: hypothetical protein [unclassified Mesorhizobium]|uniref:hypothetical protein n=1 Tax=unclassified Mesorhizobium TaxID=325217 RepID=UPI00112B0462|nr:MULTISPECIES: hypothetical protein [unclassified Mesorhizobium]MBZ9807389.1 hypothetical protein [Mesorhizobium sp. ESP-6-2]TPM25273.1 hypothetical protein FJ955_24435 [Mesorhizobium sp. B2-2-2]
MRLLAIMSVSLMLAAPAAALAQAEQQNPDKQAPSEKCRAKPDGNQQPTDNTLTETLNDCGGVLKPPPTGDQGMAAPAPNEGKTPVIKPDEVPPQPPKQ